MNHRPFADTTLRPANRTHLPRAGAYALVLAAAALAPSASRAAAPVGWLDLVDSDTRATGGWATDPDNPAVDLTLEITIDGVLHKRLRAGTPRADLAGQCTDGSCAFNWIAPPVGQGTHTVRVYARGINSAGVEDGERVEVSGSPKYYAPACSHFVGPPYDWCIGNTTYWTNRSTDVTYFSNPYVRFGINRSYGGAMMELYDEDWNTNLVDEHGGSAVQLSFYGNGAPHQTYYSPPSDDGTIQAIPDRQFCNGGEQHGSGLHNPIQTIGRAQTGAYPNQWRCEWQTTSNDGVVLGSGPDWIEVQQQDPAEWFMADVLPGLTWSTRASLLGSGVKLEYRVKDTGENLTVARQEAPALFPAAGMNVYYYRDANGVVQKVLTNASCNGTPACTECQLIPGTDKRNQCIIKSPTPPAVCAQNADLCTFTQPGFQIVGEFGSGVPWVTACRSDESHCLTASIGNLPIAGFALGGNQDGTPYMTPTSAFAMANGLDLLWNVRLYPYKYDRTINGISIETRISANPNYSSNPTFVPAARSCLGGCSGTWGPSNVRDQSPATAWSSVAHASSQLTWAEREWVAFWFNGTYTTNTIWLVPRRENGSNQGLPRSVRIYYSGGGLWNYLRTVELPPDVGPEGVEISIPRVVTDGLMVDSQDLRLASVGGSSGYYFQLADIRAGLR